MSYRQMFLELITSLLKSLFILIIMIYPDTFGMFASSVNFRISSKCNSIVEISFSSMNRWVEYYNEEQMHFQLNCCDDISHSAVATSINKIPPNFNNNGILTIQNAMRVLLYPLCLFLKQPTSATRSFFFVWRTAINSDLFLMGPGNQSNHSPGAGRS